MTRQPKSNSDPESQFVLCEQRREILKSNEHMLVLGGPGAGKTTIALLKARRVVLQGLRTGQSVLFLSFSNAAVRRIAESSANLLEGDVGRHIQIKTYHSFAWDLLRAHGYLVSSKRRLSVLCSQDADVRRAGMSEAEWQLEQIRLANEEGLLSYDQFAPKALALLERSQCLREIYANAHPWILVDEFQDTDNAQWAMVKTLAASSSVMAFGDKGQRVYAWRKGVTESRLDQFATELQARVFDFRTENHRSPTTDIGAFGQALLDPKQALPDSEDVQIVTYQPQFFGLVVKLAVKHTIGESRQRAGKKDISVAVAGRSKAIVRRLSDELSESHTASGKTHRAIPHDVLIDQSQIMLAARVTAFLLEARTYDETEALARTIELIADMHRCGGKKTHIKKSDQLMKWASLVREENPRNTKLVSATRILLTEIRHSDLSGSPTQDWIFVRDKLEASDVEDLNKVASHVRFLRILRRGSAIEQNLADLWRRQLHYRGAVPAVESAILREQLIDSTRPPAVCTVMTMHQLKGREYDAVVLVEDRHHRFVGRENRPPYPDTRRLLQMSVTRARHIVVIGAPKKDSTFDLLY